MDTVYSEVTMCVLPPVLSKPHDNISPHLRMRNTLRRGVRIERLTSVTYAAFA